MDAGLPFKRLRVTTLRFVKGDDLRTDYYRVLQVDRNASPEVIEKAYKALSLKYHPDRQPADRREWATGRMLELNEAYAVLSDAEKRARYDWMLRFEPWLIFWEQGLIGLTRRYLS